MQEACGAAGSLWLPCSPPDRPARSLSPIASRAPTCSDDLRAFNAGLGADEGLPAIGDGQLDFSLRLFDLNQDGTLTAEELLRSLALDGAVSEDAVDAEVFGVFDSNRNGKVDSNEWQRALGDLGAAGDGAKKYVFERVDRLTESGGQLNETDFGTALTLLRTVVLGY